MMRTTSRSRRSLPHFSSASSRRFELEEHRCNAGGAIGILREQSGRLMIAVAVAAVALEPRDEHQGPLFPDDAHDVAEQALFAPLFERLVEALRARGTSLQRRRRDRHPA